MDAGVLFFFLFVFKRRKEDIMTSVNRERRDIHAFQKERSGKDDDLVPRLFPFLFQKEKRKRLSVILSVEKREDAQQGFSFSFLFFVFCRRKEEDLRPCNGERKASSFFLFS